MDIRIKDSILFGSTPGPSNTVLVSNMAAEHLTLAADVTLCHEVIPPGRDYYGQTLESVARLHVKAESWNLK